MTEVDDWRPMTAESLEDIAQFFETLASDQIGSIRWQSTRRAKDECSIKAAVWKDAAALLRQTTIIERSEKIT